MINPATVDEHQEAASYLLRCGAEKILYTECQWGCSLLGVVDDLGQLWTKAWFLGCHGGRSRRAGGFETAIHNQRTIGGNV